MDLTGEQKYQDGATCLPTLPLVPFNLQLEKTLELLNSGWILACLIFCQLVMNLRKGQVEAAEKILIYEWLK